MAAANAFTWGSLVPEVGHALASNGIDPVPAIDLTVASLLLIVLAYFGGKKYRSKEMVPPPRAISLSALMELAAKTLHSFVQGYLGPATKSFFPILATLFLFILFNNLIGAVPGFNPPTDKISVTLTLGLFIFFLYQAVGFKTHGLRYVKHFCGPIWWMSWLILPIEVISHLVRPLSLALRLFGNMTGDHKLVAIFFGILPLLLPLPFMGMGLFVSFIQAFVFLLLSLVYISGSLEEEH